MGNSRFSEGVFLGVILGGAAVFLFGTKKGRKLLDVITQEGADEFEKIIEEIKSETEDILEESEPQESKDHKVKDDIAENLKESQVLVEENKPKVKRFFRSTKK